MFCLSYQIFLAFKWHRFHFGLLFADAIFRLNVLLKAGHVDLADTIICRCSTRHPLHLNFVIGMEMYTLPRQQYQINLNIQRSSCTRHVLPNNLKVSPGMPVLMRFSFTPLTPPLPHPPRLHLASTTHESDGGERERNGGTNSKLCKIKAVQLFGRPFLRLNISSPRLSLVNDDRRKRKSVGLDAAAGKLGEALCRLSVSRVASL